MTKTIIHFNAFNYILKVLVIFGNLSRKGALKDTHKKKSCNSSLMFTILDVSRLIILKNIWRNLCKRLQEEHSNFPHVVIFLFLTVPFPAFEILFWELVGYVKFEAESIVKVLNLNLFPGFSQSLPVTNSVQPTFSLCLNFFRQLCRKITKQNFLWDTCSDQNRKSSHKMLMRTSDTSKNKN